MENPNERKHSTEVGKKSKLVARGQKESFVLTTTATRKIKIVCVPRSFDVSGHVLFRFFSSTCRY